MSFTKEFRVPQNEFLGVPQPSAVLVGSALGIVFIVFVIALVDTVWVAALSSFIYGLMVLVPGALSIKLWRRLRDSIGG